MSRQSTLNLLVRLHVLSIINLTKVSIREQIAFACLHYILLLCSWHFLAVWNDSTSFSRADVVPNDRCSAPSIFTFFSVRCMCIEGLENPHLRTVRSSLRWCELSSNAPLIVSCQSFSFLYHALAASCPVTRGCISRDN